MTSTPNLPTILTGHRATDRPSLAVVSVERIITANTIHLALMTDALNRPDCELHNAAHHLGSTSSPSTVDAGASMRCVVELTSSEHERTFPCDERLNSEAAVASNSSYGPLPALTVTPSIMLRIYFTEEFQPMGNLRHPVDIGLENLAFLRRDIEQDFLEDDGIVCDTERGVLIQFDQAVASMKRAREREKAFQLAVKQDFQITRYTQQQFAEAGLSIGPIEPDAA